MIQTHNPLPVPRTTRSPKTIAADIRSCLPKSASWVHVRHYVQAMDLLDTWEDKMGTVDDIKDTVTLPSLVAGFPGRDIALGFLINAGYWRGLDARRIKDEIRQALRGEVHHV